MNDRAQLGFMLQGTGSDVGKSVLVAGLCRLAKRQGISVRPFKPQNMSNNAAVADVALEDGTGGEIGRAQYVQAMACGAPSSVHMNPVLLKPQSETGSQIVVQGKVVGAARGRDYQGWKPQLMQSVLESYETLRREADMVIVEGAGSAAEINLRGADIANMGFATRAGVPVVLVGDIDRGGVIASLVGTKAILPPADAAMVEGYLINKFRGDVSLFDDGLVAIGQHTGWRSFGVVPWLPDANRLPPEDSVALERRAEADDRPGAETIIVPVLSRIANFDDLDPLKSHPGVCVEFVRPGEVWPRDARLVVLPGSKSTIADLMEFQALGWDHQLHRHVAAGGHVIGICGGYQMLGKSVRDPEGIEGATREAAGLGLLDVETVLVPQKTVRNGSARDLRSGLPLTGYEIHMGRTRGPDTADAMIEIDGQADGAVSLDGKVVGCYMHGMFAADEWRSDYLRHVGCDVGPWNYRGSVDAALDSVALALEEVIDPAIFSLRLG